jgi:hypothetical protein
VLVASVDLMRTPTKERLAEHLARTIHDDIASPLLRARERLRVFAGLRVAPVVTVDPDDGSIGFSFEAARRSEDIDATLERLLELPGRLAAERRRRAVLVLDEFQEVTDVDPRLPRLMRAVFQGQPEVAHVYLGSKRHLMERIFGDELEPFWRSAKRLELGPIDPEQFRGHLRSRFRATRRRVDERALDAVLALTRGHPYATQELCYFLWEAVAERATASAVDVDAALVRVLRSEHAHFSRVWEQAARGQRLVLQALAREPGRPLAGEYRRRHGLGAASSVQKAVEALVRDELVAREPDGSHRIAEPFLAEWIGRLAA